VIAISPIYEAARRRKGSRNDDEVVTERQPAVPNQGAALLDLYDRALPQVYGYLLPRCGSPQVAEDLTAETFLGAVAAIRRRTVDDLTTAWLVGIARHKLVDHWRRQAREERKLRLAEAEPAYEDDSWESRLDAVRAHEVLARLGAHHRSPLMLRYLDGLSVAEVAAHLRRSVHATEALLVRARAAFRKAYEEGGADDD
jgi:RNA polymerase sigma-70 factor (ECF subfamily)